MVKTHKKVVFIFLILFFCLVYTPKTIVSFADSEKEIVVQEIQQDYSAEGNTIPSLLDDGYSYRVSVYQENGTTLVEQNISTFKYKFPKPGVYILKWTLEDDKTGESFTKTTTMTLNDIVSPEIFLKNGYNSIYNKGDTITVSDVSILDDSGENITEYTTKILFNGTDITSSVQKTFTLDVGEYTIIYEAKDSSGNQGKFEVNFEVVGEKDSVSDGKKGCQSKIGGNNVLLLLMVVGCGIALRKGKMEKL